jgi:hypothetical protein
MTNNNKIKNNKKYNNRINNKTNNKLTYKKNAKLAHKKYNKKTFKKLNCAPGIISEYTCYDKKTLNKLKELWNNNHPDDLIVTNNYKKLWEELKEKLSYMCNNELCWINSKLSNENIDRQILKNRFAPFHPTTWNINKNTWLSSTDIIKVMNGYEKIYKNFNFIGPSPIDFDKKFDNNTCVFSDICNFNIKKFLNKNINIIAFIFNTDPHYKSGSHWIALYLDINKKFIFFFDSTGDKIPIQIKKLCDRIIEQCREININLKYDDNYNYNHQQSDTECGMYCLYFIISLLTGKRNPEYFKNKKIKDDYVEKFRKIYFNEPQ